MIILINFEVTLYWDMLCKSENRLLVKDKQRVSGNRTMGKPFRIVKVNSCYMGVVLKY